MTERLRILHLEDNPNDAELVKGLLTAEGLACELLVVQSREEFASALARERFDLIISDFSLPSYDGRSALLLAREKTPDVPYIFFSGTIGEDAAIETMRDGATDYVLKQRPSRLVSAVRRAVAEALERAERKRAEEVLRGVQERLRGIYESSKDAIGYATLDGLLLDVNESFAKLTGYSKEELFTKTYQALTPIEYRRTEAEIIGAVIRTGEPGEYEKECIRKDGNRVPISLTAFVVKGNDGKPSGLAAIMKDITVRKRMEEELSKTEAQLRQAQKMEAIGQLAGGIAHDFNNLLTVITGYSQLLLSHIGESHPLRSDVEQIKDAGDRAASLTRQLLIFSRKQVLQPKVVCLNDIVANMEKLLRRLIGEHIELLTCPDQSLGQVKADPGQMEQIIMNLAVNARDAMPQGGNLTIETQNVELDSVHARAHASSVQPGSYVMLAVNDTGCGMDAETQSHLFEPFFTTKEQGKGTGLGLATVYGIVQQSGGHIWVYSEVGKGTVFKIYMPRLEGTVESDAPFQIPDELLRGTETILLVEDEGMVRALACRILAAYGYAVLQAREGAEACRLCEEHAGPIHLLITDMVMPGMSGRDLAQRLRSRRPSLKVLYMSGYTERGLISHGELDPAAAVLPKPFTKQGLARKLREVLDAPGMRQSLLGASPDS